jgi:phosphohistidine phosphatase SixA
VLLVGHQPTLGQLAAYLMLRGRDRDGDQQVVLHAAMAPELL